jgi:hypothetical protein
MPSDKKHIFLYSLYGSWHLIVFFTEFLFSVVKFLDSYFVSVRVEYVV